MGVWWGPWSWWLARRVPRLDAFEASPNLVAQLKSAMPQNVHIHNVALSDRAGTAELWVPSGGKGSEGRSSIEPSWQPASGGSFQSVAAERLDAFDLGDVGFVKIDVEGHELAVLRGADRLLATQRPNLLVEVEQHGVEGDPFAEVVEFLEGYGYRGSFLKDGSWHPIEEFDRVATRAMADRVAKHGYVANMIWNARRYVHNFLFRNE